MKEWLKIYSLYYTRCLFMTGVCIILGVLGWTAMYLCLPPPENPRTLQFPKDQNLALDFSFVISFSENRSVGNNSKGEYRVWGKLDGSPRPLDTGMGYRLSFDSLSIKNHEDLLVLEYRRGENYSYRYRSDPRWNESEINSIYQAFSIDPTNNLSSEDNSLLRKSFKIFVSEQGQIMEFLLPPQLQSAIHRGVEHLACGPLVELLLTHPETLPPLLSKGSPHERWITHGSFLTPITLQHQIVTRDGPTTQIATKTTPSTADVTNDQSKQSLWLQRQNTTDVKHEWNIDWTFDEPSQGIKEADFSFHSFLTGNYFGVPSYLNYLINGKTKISFENKSLSINDFETP
ncbi:MAG: hypothetical protein ACI9S8_000995 [Chlamydiales bacterium]|jgi:hypothetical protein